MITREQLEAVVACDDGIHESDDGMPRPCGECQAGKACDQGDLARQMLTLMDDNQRLTERNTALEAVIAPLEKLLDALDLSVDPDPCDLDHHGLCQAHGCGDMGDRDTPHCPTAVVHEQMEKLRPALDALCAAPTPPKEEQ